MNFMYKYLFALFVRMTIVGEFIVDGITLWSNILRLISQYVFLLLLHHLYLYIFCSLFVYDLVLCKVCWAFFYLLFYNFLNNTKIC